MTGGILRHLDKMLQLINQLDIVYLEYHNHASLTDQKNMSLILRRCSDVEPYD
jgi:hypothetical protein